MHVHNKNAPSISIFLNFTKSSTQNIVFLTSVWGRFRQVNIMGTVFISIVTARILTLMMEAQSVFETLFILTF